MANIFQPRFGNIVVTCLTTFAFTFATLIPPPLMAAEVSLDWNTINFGIKMEKLVEKVKRCINNGETNKIVKYMFDFKHEVEQFTGKKLTSITRLIKPKKWQKRGVRRLMINTLSKSKGTFKSRIKNISIALIGLLDALK